MSDWKKLIEQVDQLGLEVNLSNLYSAHDLDKLLSIISSLSENADIKALPRLAGALKDSLSALNSLKASADKLGLEGVFSTLCSSVKAAFNALDHGYDPLVYIQPLEDKIKKIINGSTDKNPQTYFDTHAHEIPAFINSAKGLLDDGEKCLMVLEKSSQDRVKIDEIFRVFHTLKGEANLTGLSSIATLAHEAEDFLSALRAGTIKANGLVVSALLKAIDDLRKLLDAVMLDPGRVAAQDVGDLVSQLHSAYEKSVFTPTAPNLDFSNGPDLFMDFVAEAFDHLSNSEKSLLELETNPEDSESINNIFRAFHTIKGAARFLDLQDIQLYAHEAESMLDMVRKNIHSFKGRVVELSFSSVDGLRKLLTLLQEQVANGGQFKGEYPDIRPQLTALREVISTMKTQPIGDILIKQGAITVSELHSALNMQKEFTPETKLGEILVSTKAASTKQVQEALDSQKLAVPVKASIRIQLEKLDTLMDMVGELVITESQVMQSPEMLAIKKEHFHRNLVELDRITRNLQQLIMGMRLVTIGPVFQKMERLLRDLSKMIGKDVTVVLTGEETEIDKNMAELISDPLMHMVRNSLDHGIEPKEERLARGKNLVGRVELAAFHKGGYIVIEVKDDGSGLPRDKILKKGIERGLVKEGEVLSDSRIYNLIFEPGFSTASVVTEMSGRGVGMDVVRKNVDRLHGKINISSEEGKGTVFSILFPITLAIVEGIIVQAGNQQYILPINSVVEFVQPKLSELARVCGEKEMYSVYEKVYPLIYLNHIFNITGGKQNFEEQTICILESDVGRVCLVVDDLLGQQQVVIKSLGNKLKNISGVSGAAILGDGRVGLILDASSLIELAMRS